jgi:hypothetical protein
MASREDNLRWLLGRMKEYCSAQNGIGEVVEDFDDTEKLGNRFMLSDELEEIDIGNGSVRRPTYIRAGLTKEQKAKMHEVLTEFVDCFTWSYVEMLGLSRDLVEPCLPMKQGFRPFKQSTRNFHLEVVSKVKEEVDQLLQAGFIQPCRYADWVLNVVSVEKKNTGKI